MATQPGIRSATPLKTLPTALTYTDSADVKQEAHRPFLVCHLDAAVEVNNDRPGLVSDYVPDEGGCVQWDFCGVFEAFNDRELPRYGGVRDRGYSIGEPDSNSHTVAVAYQCNSMVRPGFKSKISRKISRHFQ